MKSEIKDYLDQIVQLTSVLDSNLQCCEILQQYITSKKKDPLLFSVFINEPIGKYLSTITYNHFQESISIFNSLLFPLNHEISPSKNLPLEVTQRTIFHSIQNDFKQLGLKDLRNDFIGHKNKESIINPVLVHMYPMLSLEFLHKIRELFNNYSKWLYETFPDLTFMSNTELIIGLNKIIELCDNNLDKFVL